ncbi:MAG: TatD family hydrolase [Desulfocapsa sp.]|nr:TatD family hydrolase [Desulfocapsa sp.]
MKKNKPPIPSLAANSILIDSHCHLDMNSYKEDLDELLLRAKTHGVHSIITIGIDEKSSFAAVELAKKYPMVKATVGVHPHDVEQIEDGTYERIQNLVNENREHIVAYGEIGLDYVKQYAEPAAQRKAFREQLFLAKDLALPVIIHDREAHSDILEILQQAAPFPTGGVMHCFSGNYHLAEEIIKLGFFLSIPGVVTFKNGKDLQEVAAKVPLQSLMLETDGPFLAPVPWRGKRNEPSYLPYIAQKVADLKGISIEDVANQTSHNVLSLFNYNVTI